MSTSGQALKDNFNHNLAHTWALIWALWEQAGCQMHTLASFGVLLASVFESECVPIAIYICFCNVACYLHTVGHRSGHFGSEPGAQRFKLPSFEMFLASLFEPNCVPIASYNFCLQCSLLLVPLWDSGACSGAPFGRTSSYLEGKIWKSVLIN